MWLCEQHVQPAGAPNIIDMMDKVRTSLIKDVAPLHASIPTNHRPNIGPF